MIMNCVHFRSQWGAQRSELNPADSSRMQRHLSVCRRCQAYDQQMRSVMGQDSGSLVLAEEIQS